MADCASSTLGLDILLKAACGFCFLQLPILECQYAYLPKRWCTTRPATVQCSYRHVTKTAACTDHATHTTGAADHVTNTVPMHRTGIGYTLSNHVACNHAALLSAKSKCPTHPFAGVTGVACDAGVSGSVVNRGNGKRVFSAAASAKPYTGCTADTHG